MPIPIWAGRYIGLPFKDHGRLRDGLDCWGLVRLVMAEQWGQALPSFSANYTRTSDIKNISRIIAEEALHWTPVRRGDEKLGDVIVLRMQGHPLHVGLVLGDFSMLHIERGVNSAIEKYTSARWAERIYGIYRYKQPDGFTP